jgi:hypothetical protein
MLMKSWQIAKWVLLSLVLGLVLSLGVGWFKLAVHDKPAFRAGLQDCFKDPLCDPSPYIVMGWPWPYGVNDDQTGSVRVAGWYTSPEEYTGGNYADDYIGLAGDTLLFALPSLAIIMVWRWMRRRS